MAKEFCLWNKQAERVQFFDKPETSATYAQMISDGWTQKAEGEETVVFEREIEHNDLEQRSCSVTELT